MKQVQDIVSAMTKAWNSTSHRLHQYICWWTFIFLCDVKHKISFWKLYALFFFRKFYALFRMLNVFKKIDKLMNRRKVDASFNFSSL